MQKEKEIYGVKGITACVLSTNPQCERQEFNILTLSMFMTPINAIIVMPEVAFPCFS